MLSVSRACDLGQRICWGAIRLFVHPVTRLLTLKWLILETSFYRRFGHRRTSDVGPFESSCNPRESKTSPEGKGDSRRPPFSARE